MSEHFETVTRSAQRDDTRLDALPQSFANMDGLAAPLLPNDAVSMAALNRSDRGNAERFARRNRGKFMFVKGQGWFGFTGTHWACDEGRALSAAEETIAAISEEACALNNAYLRDGNEVHQSNAKLLHRWMTSSGSLQHLRNMLTLAQSRLSVPFESLDPDPLSVAASNGTIRFRAPLAPNKAWSAKLEPHNASDLITRIAAFPYDESATSPIWEAHLRRVIPNDAERAFFQKAMGYCVLGLTREQVFFLLQGKGGDGKSVTMNVINYVMGSYADDADVKTFLDQNYASSPASASPDLARLAGATRLVLVSEPPPGSKLNEGLIKQITGGARLVARHLHRDHFEFPFKGRLVMECNARPGIGGSDDGIWRRVIIMPWRVQLKRQDQDTDLQKKITAEGSGVLAWLVQGALAYLNDARLIAPKSIEEARHDYKRGSNAFREWLDTCTAPTERHVELMAKLYKSYLDSMEAQGLEPMNLKRFGLTLSDHQIMITTRMPGTGKARRIGARLLTAAEVQRALDVSQQTDDDDDHAPVEQEDVDCWEH